jgi:hypothetical protein
MTPEHDPEKWVPVFGKGSCSNSKHDPEKWVPVFGKRSCSNSEHDPEKWVPVFGKDHAPTVSMIPKSGSRPSGRSRSSVHALGAARSRPLVGWTAAQSVLIRCEPFGKLPSECALPDAQAATHRNIGKRQIISDQV